MATSVDLDNKLASPPMSSNFADDDPLPQPPTPIHLSAPPSAATIKSFTEFPAIAASTSSSNFAIVVELRAPSPPPGRPDRAPIDLVAVLDVSGSMLGHKLALLKRAVHFIIDTLGPSDRLSIVKFSTNAHRVLKLCRMSDTGRTLATAAIDSLTAEGWTNIKDGLETGVQILHQRRHSNPVAGLILLSDGQDNRSIRRSHAFHHPSTNEFTDHSYSYLLPTHIMPTHTFGFGSDHDPRAMHAIAAATGGTFSFIEAEEEVQDAFAMCIGGLLSVVAQQVELMVSSADGVHITSVASGSYQSKILNHGLAAVVEFGDIYADEEKDILVNVSVPVGQTMKLLTVNCSYKDPVTQQPMHVEGEAAIVRRPERLSPEEETVSLIVDSQRNRLLVGESIKEAQEMAERKELEGAKAVLTNCRTALLASASAQAGDGLCRWLDSELREITSRMENMRVYETSGRAYALSGMVSHMQQRASAGAMAKRAMAFVMEANVGPSSGGGNVVFGAAKAQLGGDGAGATATATANIGYQTRAMADMVERSQTYAGRNPMEKSDETLLSN